jgi:uncharacterized protein (TIGR02678 family)
MSESENNNVGLQLAIETLLENFIVERSKYPETFREITINEKNIRLFMSKNFGYQLKIDSETSKLEKVPFFAREWMGISWFKDELDFAFLMAILAVLESKAADEGFLLSEIIEEVKQFLKDIYVVEWKIHHNRQSFIRAITYVSEMEFIKVQDGNLIDFNRTEEGEVLYQTTSLIRYMFRNLSKEVHLFKDKEGLLHDGLDIDNPRHTLMRKLYFEPVIFLKELTNKEQVYLEDEDNYEEVKNSIETYTSFHLERSFQCFYLVHNERKRYLKQHPSFKGESFVISHVANVLSKRLCEMEEKPIGLLVLKNREFEEILKETHADYSIGWSVSIRELTFTKFKEMVIRYMTEWKLAEYDDISMQMEIYPPFIRTVGEYESEFRMYIEEQKKQEA